MDRYGIVLAATLTGVCLTAACTDDSSTDGSTSSGGTSSGASSSGASSSGASSSGASSSGASSSGGTDAGADTGTSGSLDDGTYDATVWTCGGDGGVVDVKAYATSIGIDQVHFTVNGAAGKNEAIYTGAPACTRTFPLSISYPSAGTYTTTSATSFTCSATCPGAKCTSGSQPSIVDTFAFTKSATGFVATRALGTPIGLQLAAGCQTGGAESITWTKL